MGVSPRGATAAVVGMCRREQRLELRGDPHERRVPSTCNNGRPDQAGRRPGHLVQRRAPGARTLRLVHVVILGCGRVGSALARGLVSRGHSVAVIDQDTAAFHRLGDRFTGRTVPGVGFDRDTLVEAGVEDAQAFAAVSSGDNSNIISARLARETFGVPHVVARIYDPKRAEVYERLGIPTVATVRWAADQILRRLLPEHVTPEWTDASGHVSLFQLTVGSRWVGHRLSALEQEAGIRAGCISRFGDGFVPESRTVLQEGDLVHAIVMTGRLDEVESVVAHGPSDRKRS